MPCVPRYQSSTKHHQQKAEPHGSSTPRRRSYASSSESGHEHWPKAAPPSSIPNPYDILKIKKHGPYSKQRYYELVKIYHPDRSCLNSPHDPIASLPRSVRIERYHLVVAAHELLSDPIKRTAYDHTGAGWGGRSYPGPQGTPTGHKHGTNWTGFDSPFANATWEDWERWHEKRRGKYQAQEPLYVSNVGFVLVVISAAFIGATVQRNNVVNHTAFFRDQHDAANDRASEYYREKVLPPHDATMHSRIRRFLHTRDPDNLDMLRLEAPGKSSTNSHQQIPDVPDNG